MSSLVIADLLAMEKFALLLARELESSRNLPVFLYGPLGAGKTTFTTALTHSLKGGKNAEIASPSFSIYNLYPTEPAVMHCDLYRCHGQIPEEIQEFLDNGDGLLVVEWADYFKDAPKERLDIFFNVVNDKRLVEIRGHGNLALAIGERLQREFPLAEMVA